MTRNVLEWLEEAALANPDAVAFEDDAGAMTFAALLGRAKEIGSYIASRAKPQSAVAVFMDKSPACVSAMLGAVFAGCFYTPVDPSMPWKRIGLTLDTLKPAFILVGEAHKDAAPGFAAWTRNVAVAESIGRGVDDTVLENIRRNSIDADLLYVLFTSGSTGSPKGVSITHRAVIDFVEWARGALGIDCACRFGNQAPLYFDNSVLDVYCAIRAGAYVLFIPYKYFSFPGRLLGYIASRQVNTIFWVPSVLTAVANSGALDTQPPLALQRVYFCGEVMPARTLNAWRKALPSARCVNMYGPTEITDVCTYYDVDRDFADGEDLPIGRARANTRVMLVDGEICVTGTCLSPGYYNAPELTRAAFVQNPLRPGIHEVMYKTGDLGRYNERGELMFLGRVDSQIKRRGFRIELGEIEGTLMAAAGVEECCCFFDAIGEKIICVYAGTANQKELRALLKERLPKYMLPDDYARVGVLPKTGNGKVDRARIKREYARERPVV
ncbi:MAG: amino acid adenylation domain-containing protein [Oscillospiraceae bacterium]|jgi:amino acid adenylation domain-containing protein|nr:amino acid adenylation domain-containing protein [Oscillospiraceae bacterium]